MATRRRPSVQEALTVLFLNLPFLTRFGYRKLVGMLG